ncbi:hypothetical protein GCM10012275_38000 [Longimycelium tulufanense]|uniref:DUF6801 domain-containing protein n=1 Tax=Longimycelium tulufanense TaxID=907463 RepID=A0A8J3CA72_9PSEU|nr:DUF6801 domain-containing protein [Longimycelium tulufanense]GGM63836.1 hypothetical protein GCM10012275_38000 [Longimycelium tulufanense]
MRTFRILFAGAAAAALFLGASATASGAGTADPVSLSVTYTCDFPLIGKQDLPVKISGTMPDTAVVGQPTTVADYEADATVHEAITDVLRQLEAKTVEGTGTAGVKATDGAGVTREYEVDLTVPRTPVPETGGLVVPAKGAVPPMTADNPGVARFDITPNFATTLTPKKADGSLTDLGTFTLNCNLKPGEKTHLGDVLVTESVAGHQPATRE